ncbi:MAG: hypothetical protein ACK4VP_01720, partial [Nitrospira sp.]
MVEHCMVPQRPTNSDITYDQVRSMARCASKGGRTSSFFITLSLPATDRRLEGFHSPFLNIAPL